MLVLKRKQGERIQIRTPEGRTITVEVFTIDRGQVRLAFDAPAEVLITREELLNADPRNLQKAPAD